VESFDVARAISAAISVASAHGLIADEAVVLHNSNKLTLRLQPCDVVARATRARDNSAGLELERVQRLAEAGCPVGAVEPRVRPLAYRLDDFAVTLWVYYESGTAALSATDYADGLARLHAGMRQVDIATPRFTDRIAQAEKIVAEPESSPALAAQDRELLVRRLADLRQAIDDHNASEQLLHGEPHPGNVLATSGGPVFIDFETLCRGPVEFDLAHVPQAACDQYPNVDTELLDDCRHLVLAMVAAWRWDVEDEFPDGIRWGHRLLRALRDGPPWPTLDVMTI
jgi:aminoglycoside phosphotransferase (APT) family kinase protein